MMSARVKCRANHDATREGVKTATRSPSSPGAVMRLKVATPRRKTFGCVPGQRTNKSMLGKMTATMRAAQLMRAQVQTQTSGSLFPPRCTVVVPDITPRRPSWYLQVGADVVSLRVADTAPGVQPRAERPEHGQVGHARRFQRDEEQAAEAVSHVVRGSRASTGYSIT